MLKKRIQISLSFILLGPLCHNLYSQQDGRQWIDRIIGSYEEFSSCYFEGMVGTRVDGFSKLTVVESFKQYAKPKDNKFRYQAANERSRLVVASNGNETIAYSGISNQYVQEQSADIKTVTESLFRNPSDIYLGPAFPGNYAALKPQLKSARVLRREKIRFKPAPVDCIVVEAEINYGDTLPQTQTIRTLWIDPESSIVLRDVIHSQTLSSKGKVYIDSVKEVLLSSYRVNEKIEDSVFQFHPPPTARIADSLELEKHDAGLIIGSPTRELSLTGLDGRRYSFEELGGNIIVLDFWATWCAPCKKEMKSLEKLYRRHKDKGLVVFGVNREDIELQTSFLKKEKFSYPMLLDSSGALTQRFSAVNLPTLVLIDRQGRIADWEQGLLKEKEIENLLEHLGIE